MSTTRISEDARTAIKEEAEKKDKPMAAVVDDLVASHLDVDGNADSAESSAEDESSTDSEQNGETENKGSEVIGYCPGCGFEFVEHMRNEPLIAADNVECPVPSCVEHERKQSVRELLDEPPEHIEEPITTTDVEHMEGEKVKSESD